MHNYPGKYIVIEGVDGAGKDTQLELLKELLPEDTVYTREPRGTGVGKDIREIIVSQELDPKSEILLFYAARNELMNDVVIPALQKGKTVVSNRNELTTFAYQIHAHQRHDLEGFTQTLSQYVLGEVKPDFVLYYDIPLSVKHDRIQKRSDQQDSYDTKADDFFERARVGYKQHIQKYPHAIIDGSGTVEEVQHLTKSAWESFTN